jgi:hypothetical protein
VADLLATARCPTSVPMSRPSTTPPPCASIQARCRPTIAARTAGLRATRLTAEVTSGPRISTEASTPSTVTFGPSGTSSRVSTIDATASVSSGSRPRRMAAKATARYIAPVSRWSSPSRLASVRATVDLPDPDGPSMAITLTAAT